MIGTDDITTICNCSPSTYKFTLDFTLSCPPVNIPQPNDAIESTTCLISHFGNPDITDLVPVSVTNIEILELDQNMQITSETTIPGNNFVDGDTFQYTTKDALADSDEIGNDPDPVMSKVQKAIQLTMIGMNRIGKPIINVYIITYTNDCNAYPVLQEGQSIGWTVFVSFEVLRFCYSA